MSKYSRKDYQNMARLISNLDPVSRDMHVQRYADMFKRDNASFNYDKFVEACVPEIIEVTPAGKRALLSGGR